MGRQIYLCGPLKQNKCVGNTESSMNHIKEGLDVNH